MLLQEAEVLVDHEAVAAEEAHTVAAVVRAVHSAVVVLVVLVLVVVGPQEVLSQNLVQASPVHSVVVAQVQHQRRSYVDLLRQLVRRIMVPHPRFTSIIRMGTVDTMEVRFTAGAFSTDLCGVNSLVGHK